MARTAAVGTSNSPAWRRVAAGALLTIGIGSSLYLSFRSDAGYEPLEFKVVEEIRPAERGYEMVRLYGPETAAILRGERREGR